MSAIAFPRFLLCRDRAQRYQRALDGERWVTASENAKMLSSVGFVLAIIGIIFGGLAVLDTQLPHGPSNGYEFVALPLSLGCIILSPLLIARSRRQLRELEQYKPRRTRFDEKIVADLFLEMNWRLFQVYEHLKRATHGKQEIGPDVRRQIEDLLQAADRIDYALFQIAQYERRSRARMLITEQRGIAADIAQLNARLPPVTPL